MEASREVLREAESWSTLELEVRKVMPRRQKDCPKPGGAWSYFRIPQNTNYEHTDDQPSKPT
jgi:hypothetical protein